ncbi:Lrp/AsnC family transcriptional regulator [Candidatus Woesearchaeota archaeon]|nr:Lrp/AsnC family transcriptional regulator [Candidatus Woesearchaeota archaeon]
MLDETDREILEVLRNNARTSFLDISKKLRISESTVRKRVKGLEKDGVIKKYAAIIEPSKLGYGSVAFVGVDVRPEKFLEVAKRLTEFENIKFVSTSTGDHVIMTEIWMKNSNDLRDFISAKIESMEGVTRTCPAILTERLKET